MKTTCIMCPIGCSLKILESDGKIEVSGNLCARGKKYGEQEFIAPMRIVTTLMFTEGGGVVSCKTSDVVPKERVFEILKSIKSGVAKKNTQVGDVLIKNILELGVDIIATSDRSI